MPLKFLIFVTNCIHNVINNDVMAAALINLGGGCTGCVWQTGDTALHTAVRSDHAGIVTALLQRGSGLDSQNQV